MGYGKWSKESCSIVIVIISNGCCSNNNISSSWTTSSIHSKIWWLYHWFGTIHIFSEKFSTIFSSYSYFRKRESESKSERGKRERASEGVTRFPRRPTARDLRALHGWQRRLAVRSPMRGCVIALLPVRTWPGHARTRPASSKQSGQGHAILVKTRFSVCACMHDRSRGGGRLGGGIPAIEVRSRMEGKGNGGRLVSMGRGMERNIISHTYLHTAPLFSYSYFFHAFSPRTFTRQSSRYGESLSWTSWGAGGGSGHSTLRRCVRNSLDAAGRVRRPGRRLEWKWEPLVTLLPPPTAVAAGLEGGYCKKETFLWHCILDVEKIHRKWMWSIIVTLSKDIIMELK